MFHAVKSPKNPRLSDGYLNPGAGYYGTGFRSSWTGRASDRDRPGPLYCLLRLSGSRDREDASDEPPGAFLGPGTVMSAGVLVGGAGTFKTVRSGVGR